MSDRDQYEHILRAMQGAALGDVQWSAPALLINEVVGTNGNSLGILHGDRSPEAEISFARCCYGSRRRDYEERYLTHFFHRDEAVPRVLGLPDGQLTPIGQMYTEKERKTSPVYNGSLRIRKGFCVRLDGVGGSSIAWCIAESTEPGGDWRSTQTRMIERLLPHLRQFVRVRAMLADAGALGSSLGEVLEGDRLGVIQLDRRGDIVARTTGRSTPAGRRRAVRPGWFPERRNPRGQRCPAAAACTCAAAVRRPGVGRLGDDRAPRHSDASGRARHARSEARMGFPRAQGCRARPDRRSPEPATNRCRARGGGAEPDSGGEPAGDLGGGWPGRA